jgi:hypothetical protein
MYFEITLVILIIFLLMLGAFSIPFLMQIWKTLNNFNLTLQILNQHLPVILKNMEDITSNVNNITDNVNKQLERLLIPVLKMQTMLLNFIFNLENALHFNMNKFPLIKAARNLPAVIKGFRGFWNALYSKNDKTK